MSQALTVSFAADTEKARTAIANLAGTVVTNMATIGTAMKGAYDNVDRMQRGLQTLRTGIAALPAALTVAAAGFVAFETAKIGIAQAVAEFEKLVQLSKDAAAVGTSATFYDALMKKSRELKMETDELTKALENAYEASKPRQDVSGALGGNASPARQALSQYFESGYLGDYRSAGVRIFDEAKSGEERIRGMAIAIQELKNLGESLGAIDLADRFFGKDFGEKVRQNEKTIDNFVSKLDEVHKNGGTVKQEDVDRAKDLTERLQAAKVALGEMLATTVDLAGAGRTLLSVWVSVLETIVKAGGAASRLPTPGSLRGSSYAELVSQRDELQRAVDADSQIRGSRDIYAPARRQRLQDVNARIAAEQDTQYSPEAIDQLERYQRERAGGPRNPVPYDARYPGGVPTPNRRPLDLVLNPPDDRRVRPASESADEVETYLKQLEKSVEVLKAENATYGLGNTAKAEAVDLEKALAAARSRGTPLTDAEREAVKRLADQEGAAKDKAEQLTKATEGANARAQFLGEQLVSVAEKIGQHGVRARDVILDIAKALEKAALQAALLGTGPLAQLFGTGGTGGNAGGLAGLLLGGGGLFRNFGFGGGYGASDYASAAAAAAPGAYGPGFAAGGIMTNRGPVPLHRYAAGGIANSPQLAMFGEGRGPEAYVPLPDGRSIPVSMRGGGGTAISVTHAPTINGAGMSPEQVFGLMQRSQKEFARNIGPILADWQRRHG